MTTDEAIAKAREWSDLYDSLRGELGRVPDIKAVIVDPRCIPDNAHIDKLASLWVVERQLRLFLQKTGSILNVPDVSVRHAFDHLARKNAEEASDYDYYNDPGLENLSLELLFTWTSPKEFAIAYLQSRPLIAVGDMPARLWNLVEEARKCIGFGLDQAAVAVGRMMLELALTDIGERIGRFPKQETLESPYHDYPPSTRADILFGKSGPRRQRFRILYHAGSKAIHSTPGPQTRALAYLNEVLEFIGNEYTIHAPRA